MPVDRPTLDESWYRVESLRPRLRPLVQSHRQVLRGRAWHVLHDPSNNKYYRLHEAQARFVGLLDGRKTVGQAWAMASGQLGDDAPTQGEAIRVLGQLYTSNLLDARLSPDTERLFDRYARRRQKETQNAIAGVLFARIPLLDPNHLLDRWEPALGWVFSPVGFIMWLGLVVWALLAVSGRAGELADGASGVLSPSNLPLLYAAIAGTKLIHELGHGLACKRYGRGTPGGGDVHTLGIMFMALVPLPYVDASSAWSLRSKWQRSIVGAAGMYLEMAVAAAAALVWAQTASGTVTHALAQNIIAAAGVSTLLFNANPLVRFDGYYIFCDVFELPNLARRANDYVYHLVKRHAWGLSRSRDPSDTQGERPWLVLYAIGALVYRAALTVGIILFVGDKLFFIGPLMALSAALGFVAWPAFKFVRYLLTGPDIARVRPRALLTTLAAAGLTLGVVGLVPVMEYGRAEGVVEARVDRRVYAPTDGWYQPSAPAGAAAQAGLTMLFELRNPELEFELARTRAEIARLVAQNRLALTRDIAVAEATQAQAAALREREDRLARELESARVFAPESGVWRPIAEDVTGVFIRRGDEVGRLLTPGEVKLTATADQFLGPRLEAVGPAGVRAEAMVRGDPARRFEARLERVIPIGQTQLPTEALGVGGGGELQVDQRDREAPGRRASEAFFEVALAVGSDAVESMGLRPGQTVIARIPLGRSTWLSQGWRRLRQVLQKRFDL